jgi:hypothetical protein
METEATLQSGRLGNPDEISMLALAEDAGINEIEIAIDVQPAGRPKLRRISALPPQAAGSREWVSRRLRETISYFRRHLSRTI